MLSSRHQQPHQDRLFVRGGRVRLRWNQNAHVTPGRRPRPFGFWSTTKLLGRASVRRIVLGSCHHNAGGADRSLQSKCSQFQINAPQQITWGIFQGEIFQFIKSELEPFEGGVLIGSDAKPRLPWGWWPRG